MPRHRKGDTPPDPEGPALSLRPTPASEAQWAAWCWLWRRLLTPRPAATPLAPAADQAAPEEDRRGLVDHQSLPRT